MFLMASQFPSLSQRVHHRIEIPVLNCFVSAEKKSFPRKATFLWKQVGIKLRDTVFVCEKDPVKEKKGQQLVNVAYIVKRWKQNRIFERVWTYDKRCIRYIQKTKIQGGKKILRKKEWECEKRRRKDTCRKLERENARIEELGKNLDLWEQKNNCHLIAATKTVTRGKYIFFCLQYIGAWGSLWEAFENARVRCWKIRMLRIYQISKHLISREP